MGSLSLIKLRALCLAYKKEAMTLLKPTVLSTFSGCGGMDLGFEKAGFQTVWANDFQPDAVNTFDANFGSGIIKLGDVREIDPFTDSSIPEADIVIGGFPCQDFSNVWKQPGLNGERGNFYKNFRDFVDAKKPRAFVAENVKGLLAANGRKAIKTIIEDLESISPGYYVKPKLYNFADYGVPQLRERVLIVGIRKDTGFKFVHPRPTHGPRVSKDYVSSGEALQNVSFVPLNNELPRQTAKTRKMLEMIPEGGNYQDIPVDSPYYVKGLISHVYRRLDRNKPSSTIIAGGGGGTWGYHFEEPRALTNRERARLQTFPDDFAFLGNATEVRRQIGNAVPPLGAEVVAKALLPLFTGDFVATDLEREINEFKTQSIQQRLKEAKEEPFQGEQF